MGLPVSVHVRAADPDRAEITTAVHETWAVLREVDIVFSTWRHDSDVMQLRRGLLPESLAHPWVSEVRGLCDRARRVTGGMFTTDLVGPDGTSGWDPTGLVKGWAIDQAADRLRCLDAVTFCINAGGDVLCDRGRHSDGLLAPWRVGLEDPYGAGIRTTIDVIEGAVATSGSSARGLHVIDPRSGRPARAATQVTVTGPSLTWADVWATACLIDPSLAPSDGCRVVDVVS